MNIDSQQKKPDQESRGFTTQIKQQKLTTIFKWIDAGCGAALMINGVLRYIFFAAMIGEPWTIFQPAYMILFGVVILGSELNIVFVLNRVGFMHSYLGRGLLDIFVATICSSYLGSSGLNILAIVITIFLFIVGLMFLCFHFTGQEIVLPEEITQQSGAKKENNGQVKSSLDTSQNLGRGLSDASNDPTSVYHNGQI